MQSLHDNFEKFYKEIKNEDRHLVQSYNSEYIERVILQDEKRKIYVNDDQNKKIQL